MSKVPLVVWLMRNGGHRRRRNSAGWWKAYNGHESFTNNMKCLTEFHMLGHSEDCEPEVLQNHLTIWHGVSAKVIEDRYRTASQLGRLHLRLHAEKAK